MMGKLTFLLVLCLFVAPMSSAQPTTAPSGDAAINPELPTLWVVGDSTVRNGTRGQQGWGTPIASLFDTSKINVQNRARGGRSSRTFITEGLWQQVLDQAKSGDFVLIQFGHNDGAALAGDNRERGTIRGVGEETEEVTLTLDPKKGQKEVVHTYGWYIRKYIDDARAKGMTPIVCSLVPRLPKEKLTNPLPQPESYRLWAQQAAEQMDALFIDLHGIILGKYAGMEPSEIKTKYFCEADNTHTSPEGAELNAACVVEGLKTLDNCPLKDHLR